MAVYRNRGREAAERLIKLRDYLYKNASPTHAVKMKEILAFLAHKGHEVEIKTVYRDLETLRNFFRVEVEYDKRKKGYILTNPKFEPHELRMIINSIQAAKFITQQEADRLTAKITDEIADEYTRPSLRRKTYIPNRVRSINEEAMKGLDIIYDAIAQNRKISYKYFKYVLSGHNKSKKYQTVNNSKTITASPYSVSWDGNEFTIYALRKDNEDLFDEKYAEDLEDEEGVEYIEENTGDIEPYVHCFLELGHMEQIQMLDEKRDGKDIARKQLEHENMDEKAVVFHEPLDTPCHGIGIAGREYVIAFRKQECAF